MARRRLLPFPDSFPNLFPSTPPHAQTPQRRIPAPALKTGFAVECRDTSLQLLHRTSPCMATPCAHIMRPHHGTVRPIELVARHTSYSSQHQVTPRLQTTPSAHSPPSAAAHCPALAAPAAAQRVQAVALLCEEPRGRCEEPRGQRAPAPSSARSMVAAERAERAVARAAA